VTTSARQPSVGASTASAGWRRWRALLLLGAILTGVIVLLRGGDDGPAARNATQRRTQRRRRRSPPSCRAAGAACCPTSASSLYYGAPQDPQLGALAIGTPAHAIARLERQARPYARKTRPVLPALELLAVIAHSEAGPQGRYSLRQRDSVIRRYLKAARKAKALLVLDIQPGARTSSPRPRGCASGCASPTSASRSTRSGTCRRARSPAR
jgi:hypothetical protein